MNGMANVVPPPGTPRIRHLQTQATRLKKKHTRLKIWIDMVFSCFVQEYSNRSNHTTSPLANHHIRWPHCFYYGLLLWQICLGHQHAPTYSTEFIQPGRTVAMGLLNI